MRLRILVLLAPLTRMPDCGHWHCWWLRVGLVVEVDRRRCFQAHLGRVEWIGFLRGGTHLARLWLLFHWWPFFLTTCCRLLHFYVENRLFWWLGLATFVRKGRSGPILVFMFLGGLLFLLGKRLGRIPKWVVLLGLRRLRSLHIMSEVKLFLFCADACCFRICSVTLVQRAFALLVRDVDLGGEWGFTDFVMPIRVEP